MPALTSASHAASSQLLILSASAFMARFRPVASSSSLIRRWGVPGLICGHFLMVLLSCTSLLGE
ncbi:hypothetical protein D3C78_1894740 [compost metagenome]